MREILRSVHAMKSTGQLIGTSDLWIAAPALAYQMPVVTRNVTHVRRVPHLEVETY
jgi:predicted nucleic acid-binding protein